MEFVGGLQGAEDLREVWPENGSELRGEGKEEGKGLSGHKPGDT